MRPARRPGDEELAPRGVAGSSRDRRQASRRSWGTPDFAPSDRRPFIHGARNSGAIVRSRPLLIARREAPERSNGAAEKCEGPFAETWLADLLGGGAVLRRVQDQAARQIRSDQTLMRGRKDEAAAHHVEPISGPVILVENGGERGSLAGRGRRRIAPVVEGVRRSVRKECRRRSTCASGRPPGPPRRPSRPV
jgi:hypothetical protein